MTIKTKLTLNVVIVLLIIVVVAATSFISMGFVRARLSYLTERSTPFQMRTVEFQRAIQSVTADLTKVSVALSSEELSAYQAEALKSLEEVKAAQSAIEELSGGRRIGTYEELKAISDEVIQITQERLRTEAEAKAAHALVSGRLKESENRLRDVTSRVQKLQTMKFGSVMSSLDDTSQISAKVRNLENLRSLLKDVQIALFELSTAQDKKAIIIARSKLNGLGVKLTQENLLGENKKLAAEIRTFTEKIEDLIKIRMSPDPEIKKALDATARDVDERLSVFLLSTELEVAAARDRSNHETEKQGTLIVQSGVSGSLLISNSQLMAYGLNIEGLSTKLFTLRDPKEVDRLETELINTFDKITVVFKTMNKELAKIDGAESVKILKSSETSLMEIRSILLSKDGVAAKIRNELVMWQKAIEATERLRQIVLKQAEKGKQTVSTAKDEQGKAIGTVNRMVRFSSLLIGAISIGSLFFGIFFGVWIYRSISRPLGQLMKAADEVSNGNLAYAIGSSASDEIGMVKRSMAKMVGNLKEIAEKITVSTAQMASNSEELSTTAVIIDKGSRDQTSQVEQSATAVTEMSQSTLDVARNALATSDSAMKMKGLAEQGKQAMSVTVSELIKFSCTFKTAVERIEALSSQSQEISNIVSLIREIAEQTNLLALNAAIEAAHAGDRGRGFAVVADNVRQLAERTAGATEDIGRTIEKMQTEVDDTASFILREKDEVEAVVKQMKDTMEQIDEIVGTIDQVADMVQRIAVATDQQSSSSDMVSQSMEGVAGITRQLNASIGEIKRSAGDLSRLAAELNSMAGWFKT